MEEVLRKAALQGDGEVDEETRLVRNAKNLALLTIGIASRKYLTALAKEQEVVMSVSDVVMQVFAMESSLLRHRKLARVAGKANAGEICSVFLRDAMDQLAIASRNVIAACSEGAALRDNMAALRKLSSYEPVNAIAARRSIARRVLDAERYTV